MTRTLWEYSPLQDKLASLHADSDKFLRRRADFMGAQLNVATAEQAPYVYIGYLALKKRDVFLIGALPFICQVTSRRG